MSKLTDTRKKIETNVAAGYKAVENGVVVGYEKTKEGVVAGYKAIENKFIDRFITKDDEAADEKTEDE